MRKKILLIGLALVLAGGAFSYYLLQRPLAAVAPVKQPVVAKKVAPAPFPNTVDKSQYSLTDPTSMWVVVNKQRPLSPTDYTPSDLVTPNVPLRVPGAASMQVRRVAATAMEALFAAAKQAGINLKLSSGYRSYSYQVTVYNGYVQKQGQTVADEQSARPGYSEHQTGLAADIGAVNGSCTVEQCFSTTVAGKWLAANAYKNGFVIRYPDGLTNITGYEYEPWHIRYIGVPAATDMHNTDVQTLEQYFNTGPAADY